MLETTKTEHLLTRAEAIALVKRSERNKGSRFAVQVNLDARVLDKPDHVFPLGCCTYVSLSKAEALRMFSSMLSDVLEAKGGRIRVTETIYPKSLGMPERTTYWIS